MRPPAIPALLLAASLALGAGAPAVAGGHGRTARTDASAVTSAAALRAGFAAGSGTVRLGADLSLDALDVPEGGKVTLDLAGHRLKLDARDGRGAAVRVADGAALTIEDSGHGGALDARAALGAGIGGGEGGDADAGSITITGGTVTASSAEGAGIGGGNSYGSADGGTVTITGGEVTASGGAAAGIGGGNGGSGGHADGGRVRIEGGTVTARATGGGAGIGGGSSPVRANGAHVTIADGTVEATGSQGAGIGGGASGERADGGTLTLSGGEVTATGSGGAGVGGGTASGAGTTSGAAVAVHAGARLTVASDGNALGPGSGRDSDPGTLANAGTLIVSTGTAPLKDAKNTGRIENHGTIAVAGGLTNDGTITGTAPTPLTSVHGNNYTIVTGDDTLHVLAASARAADVALPAPPRARPTGSAFVGWKASAGATTATLDETTSLRKAFGAGPATVRLGEPVWRAATRDAGADGTIAPETMPLLVGGGAALVLLGAAALLVGPLRSRRRRPRERLR